MGRLLSALALFGLLLGAMSPVVLVAQTRGEGSVKYWIFLRDKESGAAKAGLADVVSITDRALERRARRGDRNSAYLDRPISGEYVSMLLSSGIRTFHQSRWLNAVSAFLTPEQVVIARDLAFVSKIRPVARTRVETLTEERIPSPVFSPRRRLNYGASEGQLQLVNAITNLEQGINGAGVRLGIIDTGLGDLSHPALALMVAEGRFIETRDFTGLGDDGSRHALSVLSVAAGFTEGQLIGPAYGAEVLHARTEYTRSETNQEEDNLVAALEWMESEGVDVVNISLGYALFDDGETSYTYDDMDGRTTVVTQAVAMAAGLGVVVVSSAGNEGGCSPGTCWYYITAPADADTVITVGATDSMGNRAVFSSHGPTSDGRIKPDISAQGQSVTVAVSGGSFGRGSGTSFSSPMVAGIVAQILQVNPSLSPLEVRTLIRNTARIPNPDAPDAETFPNNDLGWGIIDAGAAVAEATSIAPDLDLPSQIEVRGPYPNPASESVTFDVRTPTAVAAIHLEVYDLLGRRVAGTAGNTGNGWSARLRLSTTRLAPGLYLYRIRSADRAVSGTFAVIK